MPKQKDKVAGSFLPVTVLILTMVFLFSVFRSVVPWVLGAGIYGVVPLTIVIAMASIFIGYVLIKYAYRQLIKNWSE